MQYYYNMIKLYFSDRIMASYNTVEPPYADTQLALVNALTPDPTDVDTFHYAYAVDKVWYNTWLKHIGKAEGKHPGQTRAPGMVTMNIYEEDGNEYVPGHVWKQLIEWYGIASSHELDRRYVGDGQGSKQTHHILKEFEICVLSPFVEKLKHRKKVLDIGEYVGYVECQIRKIFYVKTYQKTRLWICEKKDCGKAFEPIMDRTQELQHAYGIDTDTQYVIGIEIGHSDGSWPTSLPGHPEAYLTAFKEVTQRSIPSHDLDTLCTQTADDIKDFISGVLGSGQKFIADLKLAGKSQIQEINSLQEKLKKLVSQNTSIEDKLIETNNELKMKRDELNQSKQRLKVEKEDFRKEKKKYEEEMKVTVAMNQISDSIVKLNVGGHVFTTSTVTLKKCPDSMLAIMFSGRYCLEKNANGEYFIDRNGTYFQYILNYLRDGCLQVNTLPKDTYILGQLEVEADFYQICGLHKCLSNYSNILHEIIREQSSPFFGDLFTTGTFIGADDVQLFDSETYFN